MRQTQENKEEGIGFFELNLEVVLTDEEGNQVKKVIKTDEGKEISSEEFELNSKLKCLEVDPQHKLLFEIESMEGVSDELISSTIENSESLFNQIHGARILTKKANRSSLNLLKSSLEKVRGKSHSGLFSEVAESLSEVVNNDTVDLFCSLFSKEKNNYARFSFANASLKFGKDERVRETLLVFLKEDNMGYRAKAKAFVGLGKQQKEEDFEMLLKESLREDGFFHIERNGALQGIAAFENERAFDELKKRVEHGVEPQESRATALLSFASVAASIGEKKKVKEAKEKLLKIASTSDNANYNYFVRRAAVEGLVLIGESDVISTLESIKPLFVNQDQPWLTRKMKVLKEKKKKEEEELKSELNSLKEKISSLEKKLRTE